MKFGFDWSCRFIEDLEKIFENGGHIHVYSHRVGVDNPLGSKFFINTIIESNVSFAASFPK